MLIYHCGKQDNQGCSPDKNYIGNRGKIDSKKYIISKQIITEVWEGMLREECIEKKAEE